MGKGTKEKPKDKSSKGKDDDGEVENVKVFARIVDCEDQEREYISSYFIFAILLAGRRSHPPLQ